MNTGFALPKIPSKLVLTPVLSDEEFEQLCAANSEVPLERTKEGEIIANAPAEFDKSGGNAEITYQLRTWWKKHRRGRVTDSSLGTFLPDGSSLNPDAAYITAEQMEQVNSEDLNHFLRFPPAFVIELRSKSASLRQTIEKMNNWIHNGAQLGWLVDPDSRSVFIFETGKEMRQESGNKIAGSGPVAGFVLDLDEIWSSYSV
jgi:Uma2 family endonuclease